MFQTDIDGDPMEGYVVRVADSFHYDDFKLNVGKFVKKDFVAGNEHWMNKGIILKGLK